MTFLDTTALVETPERVRFRYRLAGPGRRFGAWAIDFLIRIVIALCLVIFLGLVSVFSLETLTGLGSGLLLVGLFVLEWLYGVVFETWMHGQTPGKVAMAIRVVRVDGAPGRFPDYLLRNLVKGVDFLPVWTLPGLQIALPTFGIALVTMAFDPKLRRLGDMVAGTVVVIEERTRVLKALALASPVTEEERLTLPVRVSLSREELQVIEELLRRRSRLSAHRMEELAELYGPTLAERTGVQADTWLRVLELAYARSTGKDR